MATPNHTETIDVVPASQHIPADFAVMESLDERTLGHVRRINGFQLLHDERENYEDWEAEHQKENLQGTAITSTLEQQLLEQARRSMAALANDPARIFEGYYNRFLRHHFNPEDATEVPSFIPRMWDSPAQKRRTIRQYRRRKFCEALARVDSHEAERFLNASDSEVYEDIREAKNILGAESFEAHVLSSSNNIVNNRPSLGPTTMVLGERNQNNGRIIPALISVNLPPQQGTQSIPTKRYTAVIRHEWW